MKNTVTPIAITHHPDSEIENSIALNFRRSGGGTLSAPDTAPAWALPGHHLTGMRAGTAPAAAASALSALIHYRTAHAASSTTAPAEPRVQRPPFLETAPAPHAAGRSHQRENGRNERRGQSPPRLRALSQPVTGGCQ
ncbi:hypothetical protein GCM10022214_84970 [Actinomadura miaoliensis]|uniref:Uncharacterized protein n=1 Tax=Actinomadura miaoliensis TaxID=430685 RepID=A0ABP7X5A8_9ACTN